MRWIQLPSWQSCEKLESSRPRTSNRANERRSIWRSRHAEELSRLGGALAQLFERSAERLTVCLHLRLLADDQGEPVYGFGEAIGKIDQDYQGIGVQLPHGAGILRALQL